MNGPFKSFGERFSFVVIPDITQEGAYDDVVADVEGIAHVASPVIFDDAGDPESKDKMLSSLMPSLNKLIEVSGPAVAGTLNILKSAQKYG